MDKCVVNSGLIGDAAAYLYKGLHFAHTPEGEDFWRAVYARLTKLSGGFEPKGPLWVEYGLKTTSGKQVAALEAAVKEKDQQIASLIEKNAKLRKRLLAEGLSNYRFVRGA